MGVFAELVAATNFSFLRGASHPYEMVAQAAALGLSGIGICDRNSMSGVVRAYAAARDLKADFPDFRIVVGTRLVFSDGSPDIVAYPINREAHGRLWALLTLGNRRAPKGECHLQLPDLLASIEGLLLVVMLHDQAFEAGMVAIQSLSATAPGRVWVGATYRYDGQDRARLGKLSSACASIGVPMLATMNVLYHEPGRRILQDVVTCIREGITIEEAGFRLAANAERYIKAPAEMARLFRDYQTRSGSHRSSSTRFPSRSTSSNTSIPKRPSAMARRPSKRFERLAYEGAG